MVGLVVPIKRLFVVWLVDQSKGLETEHSCFRQAAAASEASRLGRTAFPVP